MAKMCKSCGTVVDDSFTNCTNCGALLDAQPTQGQVVPPQQPMYNQPGPTPGYQGGYPQQPMMGQQPMGPVDPNAKSKMAAGLLGIFLGCFGVHNFYLGYTGKAIAQLLITVLTCGFGVFVSEVWGLIEGIQILTGSINTDAQGRPLKD